VATITTLLSANQGGKGDTLHALRGNPGILAAFDVDPGDADQGSAKAHLEGSVSEVQLVWCTVSCRRALMRADLSVYCGPPPVSCTPTPVVAREPPASSGGIQQHFTLDDACHDHTSSSLRLCCGLLLLRMISTDSVLHNFHHWCVQ
jgi:hypothetical protein